MLVPDSRKDINLLAVANLSTDDLLGHPMSAGELRIKGDQLRLYCNAADKYSAKRWADETADRFARLVSLKTGQYFTVVFEGLDSVPGEAGQVILDSLPVQYWIETYDRARLPNDLAASGEACTLADKRFHRATTYFRRGLFYRRVAWRLVHPAMAESDFYVGEATLNFYKTVEIILGGRHQWKLTASAIGIDRQLKNRIEKLYRRRSRRDVAHALLDDPSALDELSKTVSYSQDVARLVIENYIRYLRQQKEQGS